MNYSKQSDNNVNYDLPSDDNSPESRERKRVKRRLDDLLEKKRLKQNLDFDDEDYGDW